MDRLSCFVSGDNLAREEVAIRLRHDIAPLPQRIAVSVITDVALPVSGFGRDNQNSTPDYNLRPCLLALMHDPV
jgi:hypothetical protein